MSTVLVAAACKGGAQPATPPPAAPADAVSDAPAAGLPFTRLVYGVGGEGAAVDERAIAASEVAARRRLAGMAGVTVTRDGNRLVVDVPASATLASVKAALVRPGVLEFAAVLAEHPYARALFTSPGALEGIRDTWQTADGKPRYDYYVVSRDRAALDAFLQAHEAPNDVRVVVERVTPVKAGEPRSYRTYVVATSAQAIRPGVTAANVERDPATGRLNVNVTFDARGQADVAALTRAQIGNKVVILVDGEVVAAPVVMNEISGGRLVISLGGEAQADDETAAAAAAALAGGPLPVALTPLSESVIGPANTP